jgi:two-component system, NtrC family, sensor kinase
MRLARRLSFAISLGICVVLGVNAWLRIAHDRAAYRADAQRDHSAFGRGLAAAIEFVWMRDGKDGALAAVEQFNRRESHLTVRWVWLRAPRNDPEFAARDPALAAQARDRAHSDVVRDAEGVPHMLTYAPVKVAGARAGALELYESLAPERDALNAILVRAGETTALLLVFCIGITFGFGVLFVANPLRALVAKANRIGAGDLSGPLQLGGDDEIRDLAVAMNVMCERLSEARERVTQEAQARIRTLEQLRHADRLRTVGELASGIAHQLGTPLNVVRARGSMIAAGEVPEARMRALGTVIVEHVDRMSATIRQLLDFARSEQPNLASGDLAKTVEQAVALVEPLASQRKVRLELGATTTARLRMDSGQVHQALTNVLVNALHATPEGGSVSVALRAEPDAFVVEVRDSGEGVPAEHVAHIFEPFFTTKRAGDGTGLGLSVADGIIRQHAGSIEVDAALEQGALFRIRLPRGEH